MSILAYKNYAEEFVIARKYISERNNSFPSLIGFFIDEKFRSRPAIHEVL